MASDFLTSVLRRAVPTVPITSARISWYHVGYIGWGDRVVNDTMYYITCDTRLKDDKGARFWCEFKRRYPRWRAKMLERVNPNVSSWNDDDGPQCPSFPSVEDLLRWLGDTIDPSGSLTKLLLLLVPAKGD